MTDDRRKEEERKRKERERARERLKQLQEQRQVHKRRSLHDKHRERRKRDCMVGMPFVVAFQGDPTQLFYCNDIPDRYELIPRTKKYSDWRGPLARLKQYMKHKVVWLHKKVLIWKAS